MEGLQEGDRINPNTAGQCSGDRLSTSREFRLVKPMSCELMYWYYLVEGLKRCLDARKMLRDFKLALSMPSGQMCCRGEGARLGHGKPMERIFW